MGYAVYEDPDSRGRWAGYGVPAICDIAYCEEKIDRGLGYKCESGHQDEDEDGLDPEFEDFGCGLYFCAGHRYDSDMHQGVIPKPDTPEWSRHILTDESWARWRRENPDQIALLGSVPTA